MPDSVNIVSPHGVVQSVAADALPAFEARGYAPESNEEEAQRVVGTTLEQEHGGVSGTLQAGAEALARGASFGASDFLAGDLFGGEAVLMRRQVNPGVALGGELLGGIAPGVLSGGTGTLGTLARLTPRGLAAAKAGAWITGAASRGGAIARGIAYETAESGAEMALGYLAQRSLERGDVSAADLARTALRGAAIGVVSGTFTGALSKLPGRGGVDAPGVPASKAGSETPQAAFARRAEAGVDEAVSTADLAGRKSTARSLEAHRELLADVRSKGRRDFLAEVDDVMQSPGVRLGLEQADREILERALVARARDAARAGSDAVDWSKRYGRKFAKVKGENTYQRALAAVPRKLNDEGAGRLAVLDDAMDGFDAELMAIRSAASEAESVTVAAGPDLLPAAPTIWAKIKATLASIRSAPAMQAAVTVAGGLEVAQRLGAPVPTVSQALGGGAVGKAVGLFLEANAAGGALAKLGILRGAGGPLARAVAAAGKHRAIIAQVVQRGIGAASAPARRIVAKAPRIVAKAWDRQQANEMRQSVADAVMSAPMPIAEQALAHVERVTAYLDQHAPQNPMAGTPWAKTWKLGEHEASDWNRRVDAAMDPDDALARAFDTPFASLEVEALRAVHPDIFAEVQASLAALEAPDIAKMRPVMREALGQAFGVPLTVSQVPGYSMPSPEVAMPEPSPRFARPGGVNSSPLVTGEELSRG